eukprot:35602_1
MNFTIHLSKELNVFLDCTIWMDQKKNIIRTKTYKKPLSINEYTKSYSNGPRSTLKSIVCGILHRYIIINDDEDTFIFHRNNLYNRLQELGWKWSDIRQIKGKPSYSKRDEYIERYISNQSMKKHEYLERHGRINMVPYPNTDEDTIICTAERG